MKKLFKIVSFVLAAAMLLMVPGTNTLKASAAEPKTYSIGYVDSENDWRWQEGSPFTTEKEYSDLFYLKDHIKDGDALVIYSAGAPAFPRFEIPVHLSNLTLSGESNGVVVTTNGIDDFYALEGSYAAVNGNIKNAHVYNNTQITMNDNVESFEMLSGYGVFSVVTCGGTVGHAVGRDDGGVYFEAYNVTAGKFHVENTNLKTASKYYSTTAPAATPQPSAPAQPSVNTSTSTSASEYDDVPKTGEANTIFLLLGVAAVAFMGSRALKRA